jgi:hypothetical protein
VVGKICGGKKKIIVEPNLSLNCLIRFFEILTGVPPLGTSILYLFMRGLKCSAHMSCVLKCLSV